MAVKGLVARPPVWQERLGQGLMILASLGALFAFYASIAGVRAASPATVWVETWRMFGFVVFAGLFGLLAIRPRLSAGVWELAFFHKLAMAVSAMNLTDADEAIVAGSIDAVLALLLAAAYVLTRAWTAWRVREGA
jgi:hypothetical protein